MECLKDWGLIRGINRTIWIISSHFSGDLHPQLSSLVLEQMFSHVSKHLPNDEATRRNYTFVFSWDRKRKFRSRAAPMFLIQFIEFSVVFCSWSCQEIYSCFFFNMQGAQGAQGYPGELGPQGPPGPLVWIYVSLVTLTFDFPWTLWNYTDTSTWLSQTYLRSRHMCM